MKCILHIGTEKTGTTSIQEYLYTNQDILMKNGYYFLQSAGKKNNRALPAYCLNSYKDDFLRTKKITTEKDYQIFKQKTLDKFDYEIKTLPTNIHTVIISSEHFHSRINTEENIEYTYNFLSLYFSEINIICYLREQVKTATSHYSTCLKGKAVINYKDYMIKCNPQNIYFNYDKMLLNWEKVFSKKALNVNLFEQNEFINHNILDDFTDKINPKLIGQLNTNIDIKNGSLRYQGQILKKALNQSNNQNKILIINECDNLIYNKLKGRGGEEAPLKQQQEIYDSFIESNDKVRKKFFPNKIILFSRPIDESNFDNTIDDNFTEILSNIFNLINGPKTLVSDNDAFILRDIALKLEHNNLNMAISLMELAHKIKPSGKFILKKLKEYKEKNIR